MIQAVGDLLAAWPEERRFVDARGLLVSGEGQLVVDGDGFATLGHPYGCSCLVGACGPLAVAAAKHSCLGEDLVGDRDWRILIAPEDFTAIEEEFVGWRQTEVWIHRLEQSALVQLPADPKIRWVAAEEPGLFARWPVDSAEEFRRALAAGKPLAAAVTEEGAVAVAYAPLETERFWDVSVDTLPAWRRQGLAAACYEVVRRVQADRGLEPVWGADADNLASRRMAARLGFVEDSLLLSLWPPVTEHPSTSPGPGGRS